MGSRRMGGVGRLSLPGKVNERCPAYVQYGGGSPVSVRDPTGIGTGADD